MTQDPERLAERLEERIRATEAEAAAMAAKIEDRLRKTEVARTLDELRDWFKKQLIDGAKGGE